MNTSTLKRLGGFSLISIAFARAEAQSYTVLSTGVCDQHYEEVSLLPAGSDFIEQVRAQARMFVESIQGTGLAVRKLTLLKDSNTFARPVPDDVPTYRKWRALYLGPERHIFAHVFAVGDSASVWISDGTGGITYTPLVGSDPLHGRVGDWEFEVVRFRFWSTSSSRSAEERAKSDCKGEVFVQTPATLNDETARGIARAALDKLSASTNAVVAIRNDDWFYGWDRASGVSRRSTTAGPDAAPPTTKESYDKLPQYMCFTDRIAKMHCYRPEGDTLRQRGRRR